MEQQPSAAAPALAVSAAADSSTAPTSATSSTASSCAAAPAPVPAPASSPTSAAAPVAAPPAAPSAVATLLSALGGGGGGGGGGGPLSAPSWDPDALPPSAMPPGAPMLRRIRNELRQLLESPLPGIVVVPDDEVVTRMHALITGPSGTPYANGFFYFLLQMPPDYPTSPPRVRLQTTGGGAVRFNPNLYANGKVCLSILGTWAGPSWSPALTLSAVLLSIQSLLSEQPLRNEPGWEGVSDAGKLAAYNAAIAHETLRVAVVDNVARQGAMHPSLREAMLPSFAALREEYAEAAGRFRHLDGGPLRDTLDGTNKGTFAFAALGERIAQLADAVDAGELT